MEIQLQSCWLALVVRLEAGKQRQCLVTGMWTGTGAQVGGLQCPVHRLMALHMVAWVKAFQSRPVALSPSSP